MISFIGQKTKTLVMHRATNRILLIFVLAAAVFYMYLISTTVYTLTALEKTKQHTQSLSVEVSELESKRLLAENDMDIKKALQLGLVQIAHPIFIMRNPNKVTLSLKID